jgi:hypothetical protein
MTIREGANAQLKTLRSSAQYNPKWLVEDMLPLGAVEAGWSNEPTEFNYELVELGLQVAYPTSEQPPLWRDHRVMQRGAAALIFGDEHVMEGVVGRLILLDPKQPKHIVTEANHKLFEYGVADGLYELSKAGVELERRLLSIKNLRLVVFSALWPFLPNGFGRPGHSIRAWAWLRKLADQTGATVLAILDSHQQTKKMWQRGIRLAAECRLPQEGAR